MVAVYADTAGAVNNNGLYLRTIRAYLNPTIPCKGTAITFQFNSPQDGDYIATGSNSSTFTMSEDPGDSGCNTYAKMGSMVKGVRQIEVDAQNGSTRYTGTVINVDFDGEYHADNETNGYSYRSSIVDPYASNAYWKQNITPTSYPVPSGTLSVWVLYQQASIPNRQVTLKWSALNGGTIFYIVYGKKANSSNWDTLLADEGGPSATVTIPSNQDYLIKIQGCIRKVGNCVDSNELFLPRVQNQDGKIIIPPGQTVTHAPAGNNQQVEELNKKVASLEAKVAQSEEKQSALQQRLNDLISFIKHLFPFFK